MTELERIGHELKGEAEIILNYSGERHRGEARKTVLQVRLARLTALRDRLLGEVEKL